MRNTLNLNQDWIFVKDTDNIARRDGEKIRLPHTWNATDGQDGGNDYFRGSCLYVKTLIKRELPQAYRYFLEFCGANSSADVYVGTERLAHHDGGYSTFRVDITEKLTEKADIAVVVNNAPNETVYPQMADFTFYGGLYRDVNLICVDESHFDLSYYGAPGITVTPSVVGKDAKVEIRVYLTNKKEGQRLTYTLYDREENTIASVESDESNAVLNISDVHLWHGLRDPYLYRCEVVLRQGIEVLALAALGSY